MLERSSDQHQQATRDRKRRSRQRRAAGLRLIMVEVDEYELIAALLAAERITDAEGLDPKRVEAAAGRLVKDFIARWHNARD